MPDRILCWKKFISSGIAHYLNAVVCGEPRPLWSLICIVTRKVWWCLRGLPFRRKRV